MILQRVEQTEVLDKVSITDAEAKELYGRVFAANIRFMDVGERVKALAKAR